MYMDETKIMMIVAFVVLGLYLLIIGLGIASYIMKSLSLYTIANRRQVKNPWMAWVPVANYWLKGSVVDDYDEQNGMKRKWRVVLLVLSLLSTVGLIVVYIAMFLWIFSMTAQYSYSYLGPEVTEMIGGLIVVYAALIVVALVAAALQTCNAICLYKIFESTVPEKSLKYMLLSILVPLAEAICLLKCRHQGYSKELVYPGEMPEMMQEINVPTYMPETKVEEVSVEKDVEEDEPQS
ncbi:MAG: hypothetical protein IJ439_01970 [Tyzzerella sp.]|nr:hypothetical protein [Tyzzerella sp.]